MFFLVYHNVTIHTNLNRKKLLEPGSTKEALLLLEDFLGEKPNADFFLQEKGLNKV